MSSPPERESRPAGNEAASQTAAVMKSVPPGRPMCMPCTRQHPQDTAGQLRRRRDASQRVAPLDCGCPDPWPCRCSEPPLSERMIDAGRDAARHLLATGQVPMLKFEVLKALWRRGGDDRALAEQVWTLTGGAVA